MAEVSVEPHACSPANAGAPSHTAQRSKLPSLRLRGGTVQIAPVPPFAPNALPVV